MLQTEQKSATQGKIKFNGFSRKKVSRKSEIISNSRDLVTCETLLPDKDMPLLIRPKQGNVDLAEWTGNNLDYLNELLYRHGAVLFRGFDLRTDEDFGNYMGSLPFELIPYFEGSTPREEVGPRIYTSTMFPSEETIALHNEYSSSTKFPMKVWFFCAEEPIEGGETPIASARRILARIDPQIRAKFKRLGWMLIRNYGDGLGLPWRRAFQIFEKEALERHCRECLIELQWKSDDRLRTRQVRSAILTHPVTGDEVWFNHMSFWHAANLPASVREEMVKAVGFDGLPFHTYYGDGTPIPDDVAHHIRDAYLAEKIKFKWQHGDLMIIDNMLASHGRESFTCPRKIRVAMAEPYFRPFFSP